MPGPDLERDVHSKIRIHGNHQHSIPDPFFFLFSSLIMLYFCSTFAPITSLLLLLPPSPAYLLLSVHELPPSLSTQVPFHFPPRLAGVSRRCSHVVRNMSCFNNMTEASAAAAASFYCRPTDRPTADRSHERLDGHSLEVPLLRPMLLCGGRGLVNALSSHSSPLANPLATPSSLPLPLPMPAFIVQHGAMCAPVSACTALCIRCW